MHLNIITADIFNDPTADVFLVEGNSYPSEHTSWPGTGHPATQWPCEQGLSLCVSPQASCLDTRPPLEAGKIFPLLHLAWISKISVLQLQVWEEQLLVSFRNSCSSAKRGRCSFSWSLLPAEQLVLGVPGERRKGMQPCRLCHQGRDLIAIGQYSTGWTPQCAGCLVQFKYKPRT